MAAHQDRSGRHVDERRVVEHLALLDVQADEGRLGCHGLAPGGRLGGELLKIFVNAITIPVVTVTVPPATPHTHFASRLLFPLLDPVDLVGVEIDRVF